MDHLISHPEGWNGKMKTLTREVMETSPRLQQNMNELRDCQTSDKQGQWSSQKDEVKEKIKKPQTPKVFPAKAGLS